MTDAPEGPKRPARRRGLSTQMKVALIGAAGALLAAIVSIVGPILFGGERVNTGPPLATPSLTVSSANSPSTPLGNILSGKPDIVEFAIPTPDDRLGGITEGPDGALWFTQGQTNRIGRMTTAGHFTEYSVPTPNALPTRITSGPDGALWFTEQGANKIGRISRDGAFTEFPTPSKMPNPLAPVRNGAGVSGIAAGPDGALWFTESLADKIGRVTTKGVITEYPLPGVSKSYLHPTGIAAGADGGVWFVETLGAKIGRIDPGSGDFKEFLLPAQGGFYVAALANIARGPDGAQWFTNSGRVGRISATGDVSQFPAGFVETQSEIVQGSDGALWFTETTADKVARMTTSGEVMEFSLPTPSAEPTAISAGPDKGLWFMENATNKIGRIALP